MTRLPALLFFLTLALVASGCDGGSDDPERAPDDDVADDSSDDAGDDDDDGDDSGGPQDDTDDEDDTDDADDDTSDALCPPGFKYFSGGTFTVTREGDRWPGGVHTNQANLDPYCLARYEPSQPTATATSQGDFVPGFEWHGVPPAQVVAGVLPWSNIMWVQALIAAHQQGWRLALYEELQFAATKGDPSRLWQFGPSWDCAAAEKSWYETCSGPRDGPPPGVTGGPDGESDYDLGVFDLLGNVTEWTATPWDFDCQGTDRFSLFGGGYFGLHIYFNDQIPDPDNPGCWISNAFAGHTRGEHSHFHADLAPFDDGFRVAAEPGPQWADWTPATEPEEVTWPIEIWFYTPDGGRDTAEIPEPDWGPPK